MLELRIIRAGQPLPVFALPGLLGRHGARREIGDQIHNLINFLDMLDGDTDLEDDDPLENDAPADPAYAEWDTRGRHKLAMSYSGMAGYEPVHPFEDAEDSDPLEDDDPAGQYDEDCWTGPNMPGDGAGCPISDPGGLGGASDE